MPSAEWPSSLAQDLGFGLIHTFDNIYTDLISAGINVPYNYSPTFAQLSEVLEWWGQLDEDYRQGKQVPPTVQNLLTKYPRFRSDRDE